MENTKPGMVPLSGSGIRKWKVIDRASPPSTSSPLVGPTSHTTSLAHKSGVPIDVMFRLNTSLPALYTSRRFLGFILVFSATLVISFSSSFFSFSVAGATCSSVALSCSVFRTLPSPIPPLSVPSCGTVSPVCRVIS